MRKVFKSSNECVLKPARHVTILFDGTAGPLEPSLQLATYLSQAGWRIDFFGSGNGKERRLMASAGFDPETLHVVSTSSARFQCKHKFFAVFKPFWIGYHFLKTFFLFCRTSPQVVLVLEGPSTFWSALAAWIRGIPLVMLVTNRTLGGSQQLLRPFCKTILASFEGTYRSETLVGMPLSPSFSKLAPLYCGLQEELDL